MLDHLLLPETIEVQEVLYNTAAGNKIAFAMARLDLIHPIISGNKLFKLYYNLQTAIAQDKGIITMGGAYSNHLVATAHACKLAGIPSIGIVRGELPVPLNHTLRFCKAQGMELIAADRKDYSRNSDFVKNLIEQNSQFVFVPEGGDNDEGVRGCEEIPKRIQQYQQYTHIICAAGTGTTIRGVARATENFQSCIAIPVLKIKNEEQVFFAQQHLRTHTAAHITCLFDFAGRGYAKANEQLFLFMNDFYTQTGIRSDFIYTGKLLKAIAALYDANYFSPSHRLLVLHTGGLQGNESLPKGTLIY